MKLVTYIYVVGGELAKDTSIKKVMWSEVRLKLTTWKYVVGGEALKLDWKLEVALRKEYAFIFKSHQRGLPCLDGTGPCQEEDLCGQLCAYVGQVINQKHNQIAQSNWPFQVWLWRAWLWLGISWKPAWIGSGARQGGLHPPHPGKQLRLMGGWDWLMNDQKLQFSFTGDGRGTSQVSYLHRLWL